MAIDRRTLLRSGGSFAALGLLDACAAPVLGPAATRLPPIRASADRLFDITVCLRPFRAQGPRIEAETISRATVVHNYGHGGSGWSLSWGSATMALRIAMAGSPKEIAVIGCGALGLTTAVLAQEAGLKVKIYASELLPDTRSARATGSFTPDSRIALADRAPAGFTDAWEEMARITFKRYRSYLGLPGDPVFWSDRYYLSDPPDDPPPATPQPPLDFADLRDRIRDLMPHSTLLAVDQSPFPGHTVRHGASLTFNIADYGHTLLRDFFAAGGTIERRTFHTLSELATLKERTIINCTGYGARALCKDDSIVPVRGQIGWLIPQPGVTYGLYYKNINVVCRSDGICIQDLAGGDMRGYGDDNETVDRAESVRAVEAISELFGKS